MSSVTAINSFRVLLSSLVEKKASWNNEDLEEMIHYLITKDTRNIELLGGDIAESLMFLLDTMDEENIQSLQGLLDFFDAEAEKVVSLVTVYNKSERVSLSSKTVACMAQSMIFFARATVNDTVLPLSIFSTAPLLCYLKRLQTEGSCYVYADPNSKDDKTDRSGFSVSSEGELECVCD